MSHLLLVLPILVPLATATAALLAMRSRRGQRVIGIAGAAALLAAAGALLARVWAEGIQVLQVGGWRAPFGITLVADHLGAAMTVVTGVVGLAVTVYALAGVGRGRERFGFHPLVHVLLAGVNGAFLAGDLFNLYVWFEVLLIASFVLLVLGNGREQLRGAVAYVAVNLVSSAIFLTATGLLYGATGTLNFADLSVRVAASGAPGLMTTLAMLFLVAFGIKAAVFPLFFWLPASYHTPPMVVSALFAGLLTKVGVYALFRVFTLVFTHDVGYTHTLLLWVAVATMVTGVLGAAAQTDVRRILSFHIVSQIGYMVMGLALFTPLALLGAVFYVVHHIIVKTNLFLVAGAARRVGGSYELSELGGLYRSRPLLAILFLIPAMSLAGIPPLSGFWAKLVLIRAGLEAEQYAVAGIALAVGALTLYSMTKIWAGAFWKPAPAGAAAVAVHGGTPRGTGLMLVPVAALAGLTLLIGLWAQPFLELAGRAAAELLSPETYVAAVLGGGA